MADNSDLKPGTIISRCHGYDMTYYTFFKVVRVSDKSIFLQEYESKVHPDTDDGFRPLVVPDFDRPKGKVIRKGITSYIGNVWGGKPLRENLLD